MDFRYGLIALLVLPAGCFQAEDPRPAVRTTEPASQAVWQMPGQGLQPESTQSVAELTAQAQASPDPALRREAVYAIADVGSDADVGAIGGALNDPDPGVRRAAVVALTGFDGEVPASYLVAALGDTDPRVRLDAVEALADIDGPTARQGLRQALADPDPRVSEAARELLEETERP